MVLEINFEKFYYVLVYNKTFFVLSFYFFKLRKLYVIQHSFVKLLKLILNGAIYN